MAGAELHKVGNLPSELSSFIGRRRELGEVKLLLAESRLVTLTGIGGTGKTRLALRVAAELRRALPDGVWFVDLTELHDLRLLSQEVQNPDVLAHLVRAALGLPEQGGGEPLAVLVAQLADRRMLLVLDNCEHLVPVCASLADALLRGCPGLRILATSREPLNVAGESLFAVPPLSAPAPGSRPGLAEVSRCESVALFVARAHMSVPGFELTEDNYGAVAELCQRLDGLPLAVELAAARVAALTPQQILDRLADRFPLLGHGRRNAPVRQQALRACMDWSFDLCAMPERVLWARLSVFVGGFELDAVEGICTDETRPAEDVLDLVTGLVDKSILVRDDDASGQARYRMLETVRAYGQEMLIQTDELAVLRRRHRDWYQQLVARFAAEWISDRQAYWLGRIDREFPNVRAAVEFCLNDPDQAEVALQIVVDLPLAYWWSRGVVREGSGWLDRAMARVTAPIALRARGLALTGYLGHWHRDADTVMRLLDEGQALAERLGAPAELAYAACMRGMVTVLRNDLTGAVESLEQGLTLVSAAPETELPLRLMTLLVLGTTTALAGDHDRASRCHEEILEITEPLGESYFRSLALWAYGIDAWRQGDLTEATRRESECLRIRHAQGLNDRRGGAPICFEALAWIAATQQRHERAATLLGVADTLWADLGTPITSLPMFRSNHDGCVRQARGALDDAAYGKAFHHGQILPYEDALAYALEERRRPTEPPAKDNESSPLTRRERQIADLLAQGMSNKDIASTLVISQRTAETHVENILIKLGFTSRAQVAAWAAVQHSDANSI